MLRLYLTDASQPESCQSRLLRSGPLKQIVQLLLLAATLCAKLVNSDCPVLPLSGICRMSDVVCLRDVCSKLVHQLL